MTPADLMGCLPEITKRIRRSRSILLGLDYDGTLTPIRPRPQDAVLEESVRSILGELARIRGVTVMIVSGRSLSDVSARVDLSDVIYAGNHGLEIEGRGLLFKEPTAASLTAPLVEIGVRLEPLLKSVAGVIVEPKGLTTSVHFRNVAVDSWAFVSEVVHEVVNGDSDRFVVTGGNMVWEVRPRVPWDKGKAIGWVLERLGEGERPLVFYAGDDRTDEDAFACLNDAITIKVGPEGSSTAARYQVADPAIIERFLNWLLHEVGGIDRVGA